MEIFTKKLLMLLLFSFTTTLFARGSMFKGSRLEIIDYMIFAGVVIVGFFLMITSFKIRKNDDGEKKEDLTGKKHIDLLNYKLLPMH